MKNYKISTNHFDYYCIGKIEAKDLTKGQHFIVNERLYIFNYLDSDYCAEYVFNGDYGLKGLIGNCLVPRRFKTISEGNEIYATIRTHKEQIMSDKNNIGFSMKAGDEIKAEDVLGGYGYVWSDETKQNNDILNEYKIPLDSPGLNVLYFCDVIKKLKIEIYNLKESFKLSREINAKDNEIIKTLQELNANYERIIKELDCKLEDAENKIIDLKESV